MNTRDYEELREKDRELGRELLADCLELSGRSFLNAPIQTPEEMDARDQRQKNLDHGIYGTGTLAHLAEYVPSKETAYLIQVVSHLIRESEERILKEMHERLDRTIRYE